MTTPKSPEQVVREYENLLDKLYEHKPPQAPDSAWLRSSMASLLCYMAEQMPAPGSFFTNSEYCGDCEHIFKRQEEQYQKDCISLLKEKADEIIKS